MRNIRLCAAALFFLLASPLVAGTVSYSHTELGLAPGSAGGFNLPQYDDPGGMPLIKVTLTVDGFSDGGSNTFDNEDPAGGTATVKIGSNIDVRGPAVGSQLIVDSNPQNTNTGPVAGDNDGAADFIGTDSISVSGTGAADLQSAFRTAALDMSPYMGAGLVALTYSTLSNTAGSFTTTGGGANSVNFGTIEADFTATLTYEFVPEPGSATLAVLGIGLIGFVVHRKRAASRSR